MKEVSGDARDAVELGLRAFEEALARRDDKMIAEAYQLLTGICQQIDKGERW